MENIAYCPYRTSIWSNIQTTQYTPPITFSGTLHTTQLTPPMTFTGTAKDVELLEACKEKPEKSILPAGASEQYLDTDPDSSEDEANDDHAPSTDAEKKEDDIAEDAVEDEPKCASSGKQNELDVPPVDSNLLSEEKHEGQSDEKSAESEPVEVVSTLAKEQEVSDETIAKVDAPAEQNESGGPPQPSLESGETGHAVPAAEVTEEKTARSRSPPVVRFAPGTAPPAEVPANSKPKEKKVKKKDSKKEKAKEVKPAKPAEPPKTATEPATAKKLVEQPSIKTPAEVKPVEAPKPAITEKIPKGKKDSKKKMKEKEREKEKVKGKGKASKQKPSGDSAVLAVVPIPEIPSIETSGGEASTATELAPPTVESVKEVTGAAEAVGNSTEETPVSSHPPSDAPPSEPALPGESVQAARANDTPAEDAATNEGPPEAEPTSEQFETTEAKELEVPVKGDVSTDEAATEEPAHKSVAPVEEAGTVQDVKPEEIAAASVESTEAKLSEDAASPDEPKSEVPAIEAEDQLPGEEEIKNAPEDGDTAPTAEEAKAEDIVKEVSPAVLGSEIPASAHDEVKSDEPGSEVAEETGASGNSSAPEQTSESINVGLKEPELTEGEDPSPVEEPTTEEPTTEEPTTEEPTTEEPTTEEPKTEAPTTEEPKTEEPTPEEPTPEEPTTEEPTTEEPTTEEPKTEEPTPEEPTPEEPTPEEPTPEEPTPEESTTEEPTPEEPTPEESTTEEPETIDIPFEETPPATEETETKEIAVDEKPNATESLVPVANEATDGTSASEDSTSEPAALETTPANDPGSETSPDAGNPSSVEESYAEDSSGHCKEAIESELPPPAALQQTKGDEKTVETTTEIVKNVISSPIMGDISAESEQSEPSSAESTPQAERDDLAVEGSQDEDNESEVEATLPPFQEKLSGDKQTTNVSGETTEQLAELGNDVGPVPLALDEAPTAEDARAEFSSDDGSPSISIPAPENPENCDVAEKGESSSQGLEGTRDNSTVGSDASIMKTSISNSTDTKVTTPDVTHESKPGVNDTGSEAPNESKQSLFRYLNTNGKSAEGHVEDAKTDQESSEEAPVHSKEPLNTVPDKVADGELIDDKNSFTETTQTTSNDALDFTLVEEPSVDAIEFVAPPSEDTEPAAAVEETSEQSTSEETVKQDDSGQENLTESSFDGTLEREEPIQGKNEAENPAPGSKPGTLEPQNALIESSFAGDESKAVELPVVQPKQTTSEKETELDAMASNIDAEGATFSVEEGASVIEHPVESTEAAGALPPAAEETQNEEAKDEETTEEPSLVVEAREGAAPNTNEGPECSPPPAEEPKEEAPPKAQEPADTSPPKEEPKDQEAANIEALVQDHSAPAPSTEEEALQEAKVEEPTERTIQVTEEAKSEESNHIVTEESKSEGPSQSSPAKAEEAKTEEVIISPSAEDPRPAIAEVAVAAAVAVSGAIIATELSSAKDVVTANSELPAITDKAIVAEPEQILSPDTPSSPISERHSKRRRHSHRSGHSGSKKDSLTEDTDRHHSYRKRRDSTSSGKAIVDSSSPRTDKTVRHDSGISTGSVSSHGRRHRTPEEQAAHEKRKERRAARAKAAEMESAIADEPAINFQPMAILRRMSRRESISNSGPSKEGVDKRPKFLDNVRKGESVVKNPFIATDEPHIRERTKRESKPPSENRLVPPANSHKQEAEDRKRSHRHSHSSRQEGDRERHRTEEEREARRIRKEKEREAARAAEEVAAEARKQQRIDEERRKARREERRRKRREAEERDAELVRNKDREREREMEREKRRSHRRSKEPEQLKGKERAREQEKEKDKSTLKSFFSFGKKVFS